MQIGQAAAAIYVVNKAFEVLSNTARSFVRTAASFEKFNATLKTIEGSAYKAEQSMKWIEDFASVTPFNIEKVTSSFISLRAYGLDPTEGLLRTLGDTGAAMVKIFNKQ
ncbi:MAG: tape measure protein [Sulfurimonas sp.]|nr:tape measure protein [Sulfurimonas sp.]